jgi:hypothetical protein
MVVDDRYRAELLELGIDISELMLPLAIRQYGRHIVRHVATGKTTVLFKLIQFDQLAQHLGYTLELAESSAYSEPLIRISLQKYFDPWKGLAFKIQTVNQSTANRTPWK